MWTIKWYKSTHADDEEVTAPPISGVPGNQQLRCLSEGKPPPPTNPR